MPQIVSGNVITDEAQILDGVITKADIGSNAVGDDEIEAHTTTKITADASMVTGVLPHENGGLEADISAGDGFVEVKGGTTTVRKSNLAATTQPTTTDDSSSGYSVGSMWVDTTNDAAYICVDATASAAVWLSLSAPNLLEWVASDVLQFSADTEEYTSNLSYEKVKEITVQFDGTVRINWESKAQIAGKGTTGQIYKNGGGTGNTNSSSSTSYSLGTPYDISVSAGDTVELWIKQDVSGGGFGGYHKNFRMYYTVQAKDEGSVTLD